MLMVDKNRLDGEKLTAMSKYQEKQKAPEPAVPGTRRARRGRPPTTTETVTDDTKTLIDMVKTKDEVSVEQHLTRRMNKALNGELELLASHVLCDAQFDDVNLPEVLGPLGRGDGVGALKALCSRMRRRFAKLLRDHQTVDEYEQC